MKKCLLFFVALMFATVARGADGDTFTVDGLHYEIISEEEHTVSVFCFNNPYRSISIPSYVSNGSSRYIVTEIGSFQDSQNMTTIGIPETVTEIHDGAFFGCSSLRGIIIPATVTKIGKGAFANCSSMQMIRFNGDNPNYSSENGVLFNIDKTVLIQFPGAKSGSYTIPETVTKIESWAFCGGR